MTQTLVPIPDPQVRAYLKRLIPDAFINDELTTLHPSVTGLKRIYFENCRLSDLTGIGHFTRLTEMLCNRNQLTSLPELPTSLVYLNCWGNQLTSLPTLPDRLTMLNCWGNRLTSLPPIPISLLHLYCSENQLTSLPPLPDSLTKLYCNENQLISLPPIPINLVYLNCSKNKLTSLPPLPDSLTHLYCSESQLTSLPTLPAGLKVLYCKNNQLKSITVPKYCRVYADEGVEIIRFKPSPNQKMKNYKRLHWLLLSCICAGIMFLLVTAMFVAVIATWLSETTRNKQIEQWINEPILLLRGISTGVGLGIIIGTLLLITSDWASDEILRYKNR